MQLHILDHCTNGHGGNTVFKMYFGIFYPKTVYSATPERMPPGISLYYWTLCNTKHVEIQRKFVQRQQGTRIRIQAELEIRWMNVLRTLADNLCTAHTLCPRSTLSHVFWLPSNNQHFHCCCCCCCCHCRCPRCPTCFDYHLIIIANNILIVVVIVFVIVVVVVVVIVVVDPRMLSLPYPGPVGVL